MANNPYVNKVVKADGTTIIDISSDTVTASDVVSGKTFHLASGAQAQGTLVSPSVTQDQDGYIILPPNGSGGGSGDHWAWYGTNATLLESATNTVALKDTDFATWTPSTTSTVIWTKTFQNYTLDSTHQIVAVDKFIFNPVYQSGTTVLSGGTKYVHASYAKRYSYPASYNQYQAGNKGLSAVKSNSYYQLFYKNASGVNTVLGSSDGISVNNAIITTNGDVSFNVYAKAGNYFTAGMLSALDTTNSTFTLQSAVYSMPIANDENQALVDMCIDMFQNGLS